MTQRLLHILALVVFPIDLLCHCYPSITSLRSKNPKWSTISETAKKFNTCALQFFYFHNLTEHSHNYPSPVNIVNYPNWNNRGTNTTKIAEEYKRKFRVYGNIMRMRAYRCSLLVLSGEITETTNRYRHAFAKPTGFSDLFKIINHDTSELKSLPGRPLPVYLVVFGMVENSTSFNADLVMNKTIGQRFYFSFYPTLNHAPPIFLFLESSSSRIDNDFYGWLVCWYCGTSNDLFSLRTSGEGSVADRMLATYREATGNGKHVIWALLIWQQATKWFHHGDLSSFCPFTLAQSVGCDRNDIKLAMSYAMESTNVTWREYIQSYGAERLYPLIQWGSPAEDIGPISFETTGYSVQLRFVTADSVTRRTSGHFGSIIGPFSGFIWLLLASSIALLSISLAALRSRSFVYETVLHILSSLGILLDQDPMQQRTEDQSTAKPYKIILFVWIWVSFMVSNAYKSQVKSEYIAGPSYKTKWTSIAQISNFTLWMTFQPGVFNQTNCNEMSSPRYKKYCDSDLCSYRVLCLWKVLPHQRELGRAPCSLYFFQKQFFPQKRATSQLKGYLQALHLITGNIRHVCIDELEKHIRTKLTKQNTAFITPENYLNGDWKRFEKVMTETGARFAHNGNEEDDFLREVRGFSISSLSTYHQNLVTSRLRILVSSGIYQLWKEWEQLREQMRQPAVESETAVGLSFKTSDIADAFYIFLSCAAFSTAVLAMEVSITLCLTMHMLLRTFRSVQAF